MNLTRKFLLVVGVQQSVWIGRKKGEWLLFIHEFFILSVYNFLLHLWKLKWRMWYKYDETLYLIENKQQKICVKVEDLILKILTRTCILAWSWWLWETKLNIKHHNKAWLWTFKENNYNKERKEISGIIEWNFAHSYKFAYDLANLLVGDNPMQM